MEAFIRICWTGFSYRFEPLYSLGQLVELRIRDDINQNFTEAGRIFERIQDIRFRQLRQTAILLADIPSLKAAISTSDTNTVNQKIREELRFYWILTL